MTKENQRLLSKEYCDELISQLEQGNYVDLYQKDDPFIDVEKIARGKTNIYVSKDISLKIPQSSTEHYDLENALKIYREFNSLTPTQASDNRLWTYLTHYTFWSYMRQRWPVEKFYHDSELNNDIKSEGNSNSTDRQVEFIKWRYHIITPNSRRLLRNGISRLWWYVHLTKINDSNDPYCLTKVLLKHQDKAQNLLERSLGRDFLLLHAILYFLRDNEELTREEVRTLVKEINLIGGVQNLHSLGLNKLYNLVSNTAEKVL